jgi:hypothetical protein
MRRIALGLALVTALLAAPTLCAQDASPAGTPVTAGPILRLTLDALAPDNAATIGVTRTSYAAGGGLLLVAGAGPAVVLVETGDLTVLPTTAPPPLVVRAGTDRAAADGAAGAEIVLVEGDALALTAGGAVEIRNTGDATAVALDLLSAADTRTEAEIGISRAVMSRLDVSLPSPPVEVTLARATIAPGERYPIPPAPTQTILATVERAQTFLLSGQGINRGAQPMDVYVLTIAPLAAPVGTPPA